MVKFFHRPWNDPPGFGLRQPSGALNAAELLAKAPEDRRSPKPRRVSANASGFTNRTGALMVEFLVAMALVMGALLPLAYSVAKEKRLARALYQRAIAMEIVDGEIEVLAAGGGKAFTNGVFEFRVNAAAAANLPPGRFLLTRADKRLRLEWAPAVRQHGGPVMREITLP